MIPTSRPSPLLYRVQALLQVSDWTLEPQMLPIRIQRQGQALIRSQHCCHLVHISPPPRSQTARRFTAVESTHILGGVDVYGQDTFAITVHCNNIHSPAEVGSWMRVLYTVCRNRSSQHAVSRSADAPSPDGYRMLSIFKARRNCASI